MQDKKEQLIEDEMSEKIIETAEKLVTTYGTNKISVRLVLKELCVTNRVFYNRFHNIDEVLEIIYARTVSKIRNEMVAEYDEKKDFFEYVIDTVAETLIASYDVKNKFNQFFEGKKLK